MHIKTSETSLYKHTLFSPSVVPESLLPVLSRFHGDPAIWWTGQLLHYLMRPLPELERMLEAHSSKSKLAEGPVVG